MQGGKILLSWDPKTVEDGFEEVNGCYQKRIINDQIEKMYHVEDKAILYGRQFSIIGASDDNFDQPNSWVKLYTDDVDFLKEHGLFENAELAENGYGYRYYATDMIPASQVQILRVREDMPIENQ